MKQKLTRKEKIALQQQGGRQPAVQQQKGKKKTLGVQHILGLLVAAVAFLLYTNTLNHQYALDDFGLIKENTQTRKGFGGMKEIFTTSYRSGMNFSDNQVYRPLSKALFAAEWQFAPDQPALGHWVNVFLYAITCFLLFHMLNVFMKGKLVVPFITAILFAAHPLHTEVVANIKGGDEVLCFLFCLLTTWYAYRYVQSGKMVHLVVLTVTFFLAFLSKETAITWLAAIPLVLYFFTEAKANQYVNVLIALVVPTLIFLLIRHRVLGNVESLIPVVDNYLAGIKDMVTQKTTAIFLMGIYLKLLFFPHPLSSDGSFNHFPEVGPADWRFLVPFVLYAGMTVYAIMRFKMKDPVSFGIIYFLITASIVSNVIVLLGTNYGERLMYIPSLAFCLCIAVVLDRLFKPKDEGQPVSSVSDFFRRSIKPVAITTVILVLFGMKTMARNEAWHDDETLFNTDIKTVPNSAHMRFYLANFISSDEVLAKMTDSTAKANRMMESIRQLDDCIKIFPQYSDAYQRRAYMYYKMNRYAEAEPDFLKSLEYNNSNSVTHNNYANLLFNSHRFQEAKDHFELALRYNPNYAHAANNLASVYGVYGMGEMEQATKDPANRDQHLAESRRQFEMAIQYFEKAAKIDPEYIEPYRMLAITYRNLGDEQNASRSTAIADQMQRVADQKKQAKK